MLKTLTIDGVSLTDYHIFYDGSQWWKIPEKMVDFYDVVGRNGEVAIPHGNYSNVMRSFNCYINGNWQNNYNSFINEIYSKDGYLRVESSEEPDVFTLATITSDLEPNLWQFNRKGTFTLEMNFQPQKWLKSGENAIEITASTTLLNPTKMNAKPLIEVTGTGSITINTSVLALGTNTGTTVIDCETQNCYEGTINRNGDLTITNGFPVLSDTNTVSFTGFTSVKIYPRWWRL